MCFSILRTEHRLSPWICVPKHFRGSLHSEIMYISDSMYMYGVITSHIHCQLVTGTHRAVAAVPAPNAFALAKDADAVAGAHVAVEARVHGVHRLREARLAAHGRGDRHQVRVEGPPAPSTHSHHSPALHAAHNMCGFVNAEILGYNLGP